MTKRCKPRPKLVRIDGDIAYVPLTQGFEAVIDAADADLVGRSSWHVFKSRQKPYARRSASAAGGAENRMMHQLLCACPEGCRPDHKDGDGLNNRRGNLRPATNAQNIASARRTIVSPLGCGVSRNKKKFRARINADGKIHQIGQFHTAEEAHQAYLKAAAELHGEFSTFLEQGDREQGSSVAESGGSPPAAAKSDSAEGH